MHIEFAKLDEAQTETVGLIVARALDIFKRAGIKRDSVQIIMDIVATHAKCPLDLDILLASPDSDFGHDILGIYDNMNRKTGELKNCFVPRCSKREE